MKTADIEAAIPNRADGHHMTTTVLVTYRKTDGTVIYAAGDSLGIAEQPTSDLVDRPYLILRTGALPLLAIPVGAIVSVKAKAV